MSIKTIAVGTGVYEKLARRKRQGESFTRVIDRLLEETAGRATCGDALRGAAEIWGAARDTNAEAERMERIVKESRRRTRWDVERP